MKKLHAFAAAALAAGMTVTLAGCGFTGCNSCSGKSKNLTATSSNWFVDGYSGIQPYFIAYDGDGATPYAGNKEILHYGVSFAPGKNSSYSVDYTDGSFKTEFYATHYNWNAESLPEAYRTDANEVVYYYKTEFSVSVKYKLNSSGAESEPFADRIVNECFFRAAGKNLQPVYSKQVIISHSPANLQAGSLNATYKYVNTVYENFYNFNCTEVLSNGTDCSEKPEGVTSARTYRKLNKVKNSLFDNSSLYIAVRSMGLTSKYSQTVSLFSAAGGGVAAYSINGSDTPLGGEEKTAISDLMAAEKLYEPVPPDADGNAVDDAGISTIAAEISYADGKLRGTTQKVWYAAINEGRNIGRSTMVKLSVPLSYSLGTLNFTLKEIEQTIWDK